MNNDGFRFDKFGKSEVYSEIQIYKEDNDIKVYGSDSVVGQASILGFCQV